MKRNLKIILIAVFLLIAPLFMFSQVPPLPGEVIDGEQVPAAGAPVGNGTFILLTLAAAFAIRKTYLLRDVKEEEQE